MNPKEKADELYDKFYAWYPNQDAQFIAKQCALIAVDEIIRLDIFDCNCEWSDEDGDTREYWQEVKKEIGNI